MPVALARCSMTHEEFRSLTPREIHERLKAFEEQHKYRCWFLAKVMNAGGNLKEAITVDELIGKKPDHHKYRDKSKSIEDLLKGDF